MLSLACYNLLQAIFRNLFLMLVLVQEVNELTFVKGKIMAEEKSIGERIGEMANKAGDVVREVTEAVKDKAQEISHRISSETNQAKAEVSDNPIDKVVHNVKSAVDNVKADVNKAGSEFHAEKAKDAAQSKD